jgi:hypothetical protein
MTGLANEDVSALGKKVDVLIFVQLDQRYPSMTDKITKWAEAGLNSGEIGRIVGKPANYVTATLSQGKRKVGGKK